jgi:outer membrane protein OmpA-like peptidoglycan-associated protein
MRKKIFTLLWAAICGTQVMAQNIDPDNDYMAHSQGPQKTHGCCDSRYTGWCIDGNLTVGALMQNLTSNSLTAGYLNTVNTSAGALSYKNGFSAGADLQLGCFFGPKQHFGVGAGIMYMNQQGDMTVDHFHAEYQSVDYFGNTFRQVLSSNGAIKESVNTSNLNVPIVLKYKTGFTKRIGFTADAGILLNVMERNSYTSKSNFNYEAIYKYTGSQGNVVPVYDNSPTPGPSDLLILKNANPETGTSVNVQQYFNTLRSNGYNVGLGVSPNSTKGTVSYNVPSVGFLIHPAVNVMLCSNFSLNLGVIYIYQNFSNTAAANYQVTDKVGSYSSVMNSVSSSSNHMIGFDAGLRYSFTRHCEPPAPMPAPADTIAPEPVEPPVASPVNEDEMEPEPVTINSPILFDVNKTEIKPEAYPILEEAVKTMTGNKKSVLVINGYTDNTGTAVYNRGLSRRRANAVKGYLHQKGLKTKQMRAIGHGAKDPAASNSTSEGRAMNRRVELKVKRKQDRVYENE